MVTPLRIQELGRQFGELFYSHRIDPTALGVLGQVTVDEAYCAQDAAIAFRVARGESVVGYKIGCTSKSIQQQLGLSEPYYGKVMAPHVVAQSPDPVRWTNYVDLAIEPEVVIRFGRDLDAKRLTEPEIVAAIESVSVGIELHHFRFWQGRPTSQELIVSNGLFAGLVVGEKEVSPRTLDFQSETFRVFKNGALVVEGLARDIMGGPLASLRWLAQKLAARGEHLRAGQIVIPGSPVALVRIDGDADVVVEVTGVDRVQTRFRA